MAEIFLADADIPLRGLDGDKPANLRLNALELLINQPYGGGVWRAVEDRILDLLDRRSETSNTEVLLRLAARVPLPSVRERLRQIARDPTNTDFVAARKSLAEIGENQFANLLIEDLGEESAKEAIANSIARSPLDRMRIKTAALEQRMDALDLDDPEESSAYVWGSIALGKKGRFKHLNNVFQNLERGWQPAMFWGNLSIIHDELQMAGFDSERLERYAERKLRRLAPDDQARVNRGEALADPRLNIIDALLEQPPEEATAESPVESPEDAVKLFGSGPVRDIVERNVTRAIKREVYHDIVPDALRDLIANLHELGPDAEQAALPIFLGNTLVELTRRLPGFEPDGPRIIRAYRDLVGSTGNRSADFETQLGWILAQGDFEVVLQSSEGLLASDDEFEREIAWSLISKGSAFKQGQPPPVYGAGGGPTANRSLWRDARPAMMPESSAKSAASPQSAPPSRDAASPSRSDSKVRFERVDYRRPRIDLDYEVAATAPDVGSTATFKRGIPEETDSPFDEKATISAPPEQEETDRSHGGGEPPRSAYALLDCPDEVKPMVEFVVTVGLAENPTAGVIGGELHRPDWSVGDYELTVTLLYDGFLLRRGEVSQVTLHVTTDDLYPTKDLHLTAIAGDRFRSSRTLLATYSVEGQFIGSAARAIVVSDGAAAGVAADLTKGFDLSMPPGVPTPDMTISITKGNTVGDDRLVWNVITPHGSIDVTQPGDEDQYKSDIGAAPDEWARNLMNAINAYPADKPLGPLMIGNGKEIRKQIPVWVRRKLRDLAQFIGDPAEPRPSIFIVSDEPNIPWELAYLKLDMPSRSEDFLGAAFVVGRWVHGHEDVDGNRVPAYPPPTEVTVDKMAVVSGDYSKTKTWRALKGAEQEAKDLEFLYHATHINADSQLATWLSESAAVDAIHFAVHGKWSIGGGQDGIVLVDGTTLTPKEVMGVSLSNRPLVFLNACQLGQGEKSLGDYGGIAAAFLEAGAAGVIAALWNVDDTEAKDLALDFYKQARAGDASPGEIFRQQRSVFEANVKSKLALAYQFFGHPQMRMTLALP